MSWTTDQMCKIVALTEFKNGLYVNLGIGMPTKTAKFIPEGIYVTLQSENGMLGMGPNPEPGKEDPDLINAGKRSITALPGASYFDNATSFAMIRGEHIDLTILGGLEVSQTGDLANWTIPGKMMKGMGGAMDLVSRVVRVVVLMTHTSKDGAPKLLKKCDLPLTGVGVVDRVVTDLGIFDINLQKDPSLHLVAKPEDVSLEEIEKKTGAFFNFSPDENLRKIIASV